MIFVFKNQLRLALWDNVGFVLENVPCAEEKLCPLTSGMLKSPAPVVAGSLPPFSSNIVCITCLGSLVFRCTYVFKFLYLLSEQTLLSFYNVCLKWVSQRQFLESWSLSIQPVCIHQLGNLTHLHSRLLLTDNNLCLPRHVLQGQAFSVILSMS